MAMFAEINENERHSAVKRDNLTNYTAR